MKQTPAPGTSIVLNRGDIIVFTLELSGHEIRSGRAWVRTTLGNAATRRKEIIEHVEQGAPILAGDWHDIPMRISGERNYIAEIPLLETGRFEAKTFFLPDDSSEPVWPEGGNIIIKTEPADYCCGNTIYTSFVRQFGPNAVRYQSSKKQDAAIQHLENSGYAVIPRSGTFRDLAKQLDFIINELRFRIIQLLPIHPTPTTYARMGRFGSPYAALDFKDVDPALAEFDRKTTPLDQFQELVDAVHARGARIFLDIPANHTGWASKLQIEHPEWFDRDQDMKFRSPGAWGVTWEDLAELNYGERELWPYIADILLFWTRRGVDGFRCDAGYMIPVRAWEYIVAKVRDEYPDTIFFLEGLGGKAGTVNELLSSANMDWAYSELFQNYDRNQVETCVRDSVLRSRAKGLFVHYAETHDNNRLAERSPGYARMRVALSALSSNAGAFGIANGVEWFAKEKINVHDATSLNWGNKENQTEHIRRLNAILAAHPAFHANAEIRPIQNGESNSIALLRRGAGPDESLLVLINLENRRTPVRWKSGEFSLSGDVFFDLITGKKVAVEKHEELLALSLAPEEALCLSSRASDIRMVDESSLNGTLFSRHNELQRARAKALEIERFFGKTPTDRSATDHKLKAMLDDPLSFCAHSAAMDWAPVASWTWPNDLRRIAMVAPGCFLYVKSEYPFRAELWDGQKVLRKEESISGKNNFHFALFRPPDTPDKSKSHTLRLTVFEPDRVMHKQASVLFLSDWRNAGIRYSFSSGEVSSRALYALCANGRGGMAQVRGEWAEIRTQYDAMLAGNPDPTIPVDRRIMLTRCRAWMVYQGYSQVIDKTCIETFHVSEDGAVMWRFMVSAGQGKKVPLEFRLKMDEDDNRVKIFFIRHKAGENGGYMGNDKPVKIIVRPDIEDRINHEKTKAYKGPETAWPGAISAETNGFMFSPSRDRRLSAVVSSGIFVLEPEWKYSIPHTEDAERGLDNCSDLFSPGYFSIILKGGESSVLDAKMLEPGADHRIEPPVMPDAVRISSEKRLDDAMRSAMKSFIVKRGELKTVIAGYPWFLDWGRDTLICLRGIVSAGMLNEARAILQQFGRFESRGTLPNMLCGDSDANRDTSDAPLWFCAACSDLIGKEKNDAFLGADCGKRTIAQVLISIAENYIAGTPNGVKMDNLSGLIFSPAHFTWMDTNYPAGTPRQGYPIEIQALWHSALMLLAEMEPNGRWRGLSEQARDSIIRYFAASSEASDTSRRSPESGSGWLSDCLHAEPGRGARNADADDALRPNQLLAITMGALTDKALQAAILRACEELLVPGAIRSLADRSVKFDLPIIHAGNPLNDPLNPYWGSYTGDEDTRRKPAYHNGTAWTWLFPSYSEALFMTHGEPVRRAALSILSGSAEIINTGCIGHSPEITDGDSPHAARGCGAQAWGASELYRVLKKLTEDEQ